MTAVIFGSSMGNAEEAANKIAANLGIDTVLNISETSADEINGFDKLIIGSSTWGSGDLQDDMELAEAMLKYVIKYVMDECPEEMAFFNQFVEKGLLDSSDINCSSLQGDIKHSCSISTMSLIYS